MSTERRLSTGKLPHQLLGALLGSFGQGNDTLIGPGIGCDAAAIDLGDGRVLVAASDPITFASDNVGSLAVHVNANDIACTGMVAKWFLCTVLAPPDTTPERLKVVFDDINNACISLGITVIGGHTEVVPEGVSRVIVSGTMLGIGAKTDLVDNRSGPRIGDAVLLTRGIAIEGTAIIAQERLVDGLPDELLTAAAYRLQNPGISVVGDCARVCEVCKPAAMHDPTEGGLATAIHELADASGLGIHLDDEKVHSMVFEDSRIICEAGGLDPLGLLSSGALIIIVQQGDLYNVLKRFAMDEVSIQQIGTVVKSGVMLGQNKLARFDKDEITRLFP